MSAIGEDCQNSQMKKDAFVAASAETGKNPANLVEIKVS